MTNWTPSPDHIRSLLQTVNRLTNQRALLMESDYPLTQEQVIAITTPPRLKELLSLGYDSLQTTQRLCYELGPEQGLDRRSITSVVLQKSVHYAFARQLNRMYQEGKPAFFDGDSLDAETMAKLKVWTNQAVYERRLAALVNDTVLKFFTHQNTPITMYHIMARWPALKVVFPQIDAEAHYRSRATDIWQRHADAVGRDLHRWAWPQWGEPAAWREKYRKRMLLAEDTLLSCVSLAKPKEVPRTLIAQVTDWQKLKDQPF